ncbi:MAG: carbohydrate ABC transporter permease, partial [Treponema sp.]|nr:carbohydrate ABC transporter permease [Treponema sp.]
MANNPFRQKTARYMFRYVVPRVILITMAVFYIMPYYWMLVTSLKGAMELRAAPPTLFPHEIHFEHYAAAVRFIPFFRYMTNSLAIVVFSVIGAVISNSLVGYGFSRINWPGREKVFL